MGKLLLSLALSLSARQLKPEILVCRMAALMISVVEERRKKGKKKRDVKELLSFSMLIKAIYILYFLSPNKSAREERGWGITMLWDHLCNAKSHS